MRNPACYTTTPGEEAIIPWLLRFVDAARTAGTVMRLLETAEMARVEQVLTDCAREANSKVNDEDEVLKGQIPTAEQCREVVRQEKGKDVTRAMDLGARKHAMALACVQRELGGLHPENFSVQPRYKYDPSEGRWRQLDPVIVAEWLRNGLESLLLGTLVPDVVIHASGNAQRVQRVYDFKFPCVPARKSQRPAWREYPEGHPHHPKTQGQMYEQALGGEKPPSLVTPQLGVQ
ncbi:hypothetical protein [Archangium violaceum]|uniref:hypothetical protein n=1 Tax=Archangium violaceum TaxID=83451 RepID=UPI0036DD4533